MSRLHQNQCTARRCITIHTVAWNLQEPFRDNHYLGSEPIWAIVKDLIDIGTRVDTIPHMSKHINNKVLPKMVRGLRKMHQIGIWVRDIHYKNYHAGVLFNFSYAVLTMPHPYLKRELMEDRERVPPEEALVQDAIRMDSII